MCGIAGILNFDDRIVNKSDLISMTNTIIHRGPDGEGHWVSSNGKIGFGHRRLSIIDLSDGGKQPMHYQNQRYTITFNGEIYNYIELKEKLCSKGHIFRTSSDTEVLLALYAEMGGDCLTEIDGMFAFAIWDEKEQKLFCARDRFGEKPFYYFKDQHSFIFGSEMKEIFSLGIKKSPNNYSIYNYLVHNRKEDILDRSKTFYNNIFQLEPSHYLVIKNGGISKKKYWDINLHNKSNLSETKTIEKFTELFNQSVSRRLRADVKVGSSLSGGLDSSAIVSSIANLIIDKNAQKTFSARFKGTEFDEGKHIEKVVNYLSINPCHVWLEANDLENHLDNVFYHQEEPFMSSSIIAQWKVMELAKKNNVTVLLDGQGADEYLAGYNYYKTIYLKNLYLNDRKKFKSEIASLEKRYCIKIDEYKYRTNSFSKLKTNLGNIKRKVIPFSNETLTGLNPDFKDQFKNSELHLGPALNNLNESLKYSATSVGLSELLRYADRNSMANSREVRLPFLSHELVEFTFSLNDSYKIKDGWSKWILRKSIESKLPNDITWRKDKLGFWPPQEKWLSSPVMKDRIDQAINNLKQKKIINIPSENLYWKYLMIDKLN